MKTKKQFTNRILSLVLALVMVLSMMPMTSITALAEDTNYAASVTTAGEAGVTTNYASLTDAIAAAKENTGSTLKLLQDVNTNVAIDGGTFTFDLNGYTMEANTYYNTRNNYVSLSVLLIQSDANITLVGSGSIISNGPSSGTSKFYCIRNLGTLKINGDIKLRTNEYIYNCGIYNYNGILTIDNCDINSISTAVNCANGTATINGGSFQAGYSCISAQSNANVAISGGSFTGETYDCYIDRSTLKLGVGDNGSGPVFPGGILVSNTVVLSDLLDESCYYTQNGSAVDMTGIGTEITGDVSVAYCDHSQNTNTIPVADDAVTHSLFCSNCGTRVSQENHSLNGDICTDCGYGCSHASCITQDGITKCADCPVIMVAQVGNVYFAKLSDAVATANDTQNATLTLLANVNGDFCVEDGSAFTLDLNGKTLQGTSSGSVITVNTGGNLIIKSSTEGGKVTGCYTENISGTIDVTGELTLQSGTISGNKVYNGGGVVVRGDGKFTMKGGALINNEVITYGGGVFVQSGTFTMNGGIISNNTITLDDEGYTVEGLCGGGGVFVRTGTFTMNGGTISGNSSPYTRGGGVQVSGYGKFVMNGGTITGNSAAEKGGGVYVMNGWNNEPAGSFTVNGDSVISGNTINGAANNVYLEAPLSIGSDLSTSANIGITGSTTPTDTGLEIASSGATDTNKTAFFSDNSSYSIVQKEGKLYLYPHIHNWTYAKDDNKLTATCDTDGCGNTDGGYVTISAPSDLTYTGNKIEAVVDNKLTTGDIIEVKYSADPVNVGTYTVSITLDGKEISVIYSITAASISDANVAVGGAFTYDGTEKEPTDITVTLGDKTLTKDTDYTVSYSNNMNAGTAKVTITGTGNYTGTAEGTFTITDAIKPTGEITIGENGWKKFINWISFGLFYKDNVDVTVTADGTGSDVAKVEYLFAASALNESNMPADGWTEVSENNGKYKFSIQPQNKGAIYVRITDDGGNVAVINSDGIVIYEDSKAVDTEVTYTYKENSSKDIAVEFNGNTVKSIACGEIDIAPNIDYTVDNKSGKIVLQAFYLDTLSAGNYTFTVSYNPMGVKDSGVTDLTTTFIIKVEPASITGATVSVSGTFTYNGNAQTPEPVVVLNGKTLVKDQDYTVFYAENVNAGTATVTVTGKGNYSGTANGSFVIERANLTDISVQQNGKLTYDGGKALTPAVTANATAFNGAEVLFMYSADGTTYGSMPSFTNPGTYTVHYCVYTVDNNFFDIYNTFTVTIDKATVNEPTIASMPFNNAVQKADISDNDLYTVVKNEGGTEKGSYDVVLKLKDSANYKWSTTDSEEVTVQFVISAAQNSWETKPAISGWTYGETANAPTYKAKFGAVKVVYSGKANDGTDYNSETAPTKAGNYTATFIVAETENYSGLETSVDFTIGKATYDMTGAKWDYTVAFDYDGKEQTVEVIGLPSGVTVSGYEGNKATVVGNYTAKVIFSYDGDNYNAPALADLTWSIKNDWTPTEYDVNGSGWMNQAFVISAKAGYRISLTNTADGEWNESLTYSAETADGSVTFYLKDEISGAISLAKTVSYKIDKTAPAGKVEFVERTGWEEFVNAITFGLFYKDEVTVKITATDNLTDEVKIEYYESDEAMTLAEVEAITDWKEYNGSFGVTLENAKKFVYFIRITDNAGNVTYLSTDGAQYDTTVPVVEGIENGKTYYTTQKVTVTEKNVHTITLNGNPAAENITLEGNREATYTIVVTDKAGNSTTVTVTMKPISDLSAPIDTLTQDNVNSGNEQAVDDVKAAVAAVDTTNATDEEKAALKDIADKAAELEKVIDDTKAEIARINEELNKINGDTVNSDDAPALEQLGKDIKALLDGGNLSDAERTALTEDANDVAAMQKTVADTAAENERIRDAVDGYDIATVTSEDKDDLEQLLADINEQLESTNLTEEEISELNGDKKAVEDLLTKIKGTDELIDKLIGDVNGYSEDTVKSTDKDAIEQIIEDIDALLETENLTDAEKKALEDAKTKAEGLLDTIEDAAEATTSENTEKVKDVTAENVTPEDKTDLEKAKEDLEKALADNGGNYTDDEKKAIEDEIKRIDDALEVIGNVEEVEELIGKLPENIKKDDEAAIKAADEAYNALTDYEKSLVDEDAKKALDDAKAALAELNKPADPNSPATGDNSHMMLWIALLFISGGAVITLTVVDRKRRTASKR